MDHFFNGGILGDGKVSGAEVAIDAHFCSDLDEAGLVFNEVLGQEGVGNGVDIYLAF